MYFIIYPQQGPKMEGIVLHRVGILGLFLSLIGSGFQTLGGTPISKQGSSTSPPLEMKTVAFSYVAERISSKVKCRRTIC